MLLKYSGLLLILLSSLMLGACSKIYKPFINKEGAAFITPATKTTPKLHILPPPKGKIAVSVYHFRDQTGQHKDRADGNGSSLSKAVTQGGTAILMKALHDSKWFKPLERAGLDNLVKERKIIRFEDKAKKTSRLKPLRSADLLLEGGITGYASNIRTGGVGLEYFGSFSRQYREDFVTVHLRAIDVASGQVALSISSSKRILSKELRGGLFQYVKFKELLGVESGLTTNEPGHICVADAIEKAVHDLIIEGVLNKTWRLKHEGDMMAPSIVNYKKEKDQSLFAEDYADLTRSATL